MAAIEFELQALKDNLIDMLELVKVQLSTCKKAIEKNDPDIASEVVAGEQKVNMQELAIDRDSENILALYTPVATDLRFVLATLKMTSNLERIGDNAKTLAKFLSADMTSVPKKTLARFDLEKMLDILISMLKDMGDALAKGDTALARRTAKQDKIINNLYHRAFHTTAKLMAENKHDATALLSLFSISRDLERAGDLTKNIAEELVFHIEARVLKHSKKGQRKGT